MMLYQNSIFSEDCFSNEQFMSEWFIDDSGVTVEENPTNFDINVFPNPSETQISIVSKSDIIDKIEIYDISGKLVLKFDKINSKNLNVTNQQLNSFSGKYSLKIFYGKKIYTHFVVIL